MTEIMDWDSVYREEGGVFDRPPPWNIGEPQPEIAELIRAGKFRSDCQLRPSRHHFVHRIRRPFLDGPGQHPVSLVARRVARRLPALGSQSGGARRFLLRPVFAAGAFPPAAETKPNEVAEDELREAVSKHWEVDEVHPALIHVRGAILQIPGMTVPSPFSVDEKGRQKMPAFLLTAHKAS